MIGESILQLREGNAVVARNKSYEYDEYQPITGTQCRANYDNYRELGSVPAPAQQLPTS